jgi:hypothetical protein
LDFHADGRDQVGIRARMRIKRWVLSITIQPILQNGAGPSPEGTTSKTTPFCQQERSELVTPTTKNAQVQPLQCRFPPLSLLSLYLSVCSSLRSLSDITSPLSSFSISLPKSSSLFAYHFHLHGNHRHTRQGKTKEKGAIMNIEYTFHHHLLATTLTTVRWFYCSCWVGTVGGVDALAECSMPGCNLNMHAAFSTPLYRHHHTNKHGHAKTDKILHIMLPF